MYWYWILSAGLVILAASLHVLGAVRFQLDLPWTVWVVAGLVLLNGGWMAFDGGRALIVGDFVTPKSGRHAGALGPWARIPEALGVSPRSTVVRATFLLYGCAYLLAVFGLLAGARFAWSVLLSIAVLGFWYVPFGLLINMVVVALLLGPLRELSP